MKASFELASKKNRNGLFEIYLRVQDGNLKKRIKANIAVSKSQFKSKNHNLQWVRNHPNAKKLNADLKYILDEYNDQILTGIKKKEVITPGILIHNVSKFENTTSLVKYFQQKTDQMLGYNQKRGYQHVLKYWCHYTQKENLGDLDFKQITVQVLKGFENYLYKKNLESSTVYGHMKRIRACFNTAIKEGVIGVGDYVFRAYTMPKAKAAKKEKLDIEELRAFKEQEYKDGSILKCIQQAFLLSFYMARVRVEDLLTLRWDAVKKNRIEYEMSKTGAVNSFNITPQIQEILCYFKSIRKPKARFIIPLVNEKIALLKSSRDDKENEVYKKEISSKTSLINKYLKQIGKDAKIEKNISSHIARHTFASIAIKKSNGDVNFVQNALKHSNPKITQIYLASLDNEYLDSKMTQVTNL